MMKKNLMIMALAGLGAASLSSGQNGNFLVNVDDFEEGIGAWTSKKHSLEEESGTVHQGKYAARFFLEEYAETERDLAVTDWSEYAAISVWIYSPQATSAVVGLALSSENDESDGWDYFYKAIPIDWEGWKQFLIKKESFATSRAPDWARVNRIMFSIAGWIGGWSFASPGDYVVIDEIRLLNQQQLDEEESK